MTRPSRLTAVKRENRRMSYNLRGGHSSLPVGDQIRDADPGGEAPLSVDEAKQLRGTGWHGDLDKM